MGLVGQMFQGPCHCRREQLIGGPFTRGRATLGTTCTGLGKLEAHLPQTNFHGGPELFDPPNMIPTFHGLLLKKKREKYLQCWPAVWGPLVWGLLRASLKRRNFTGISLISQKERRNKERFPRSKHALIYVTIIKQVLTTWVEEICYGTN